MTVMPVDGLRNPRDLDLVETPPPPNSKPLLPPLFWAIRSRSHGFLLDLSAPKKGKHSKPLPPPTSKPRPHRHQPQQQQCDVHESSYRQSIEVIERSRNEPAPEERSAVAGQRHASARQQQVRIDARRSALDRGQRRQMAGVTCVTTEHTKTKKKNSKEKGPSAAVPGPPWRPGGSSLVVPRRPIVCQSSFQPKITLDRGPSTTTTPFHVHQSGTRSHFKSYPRRYESHLSGDFSAPLA